MSVANDLQEQYFEFLLDKIRGVDFPSNQLMDRVESVMRTTEQAETYVEVLFEKNRSLYPSLQILDRAHRIILLLERAELRERLAEELSERGVPVG